MRGIYRLILVVGLAGGLLAAESRAAHAQPAVDAAVVGGIDQDTTAVGRIIAGGLYSLGKFAPEAHLSFDNFLRINSDKGINARSLSVIDIGARFGLKERFKGPFVSAGGGFGLFFGKPHERKLHNDSKVCASATDDMGGPVDDCTYRIDKNLSARFGLGYGFQSSKKATVAARLDFTYWLLSLNDFESQPAGAPIPNMVERPQSTWSITIGLEFMRWR